MMGRRHLPSLLMGLLLAGCTVGPDFQTPAAPATDRYTRGPVATPGQTLTPGADIPADWWTLFRAPALDALVRQALDNNPDLQSAQAALRVAMEGVKAQQALFYPSLGVGLGASRNRDPDQLSPTLASSVLLYSLYQTQAAAVWSPDIWGGQRRQVEALQAQADAQRYQLQALHLAVASNVAAAAIQEASLRAQIAATQSVTADARDILAIAERQKALGQIAGSDVAAQRVLLAQAQSALPPLEKQLAVQRDFLKALAGRLPSDDLVQNFQLSDLTLPTNLPLSLPSKLVAQRPDIRVAEENMHAASAAIGAATADMLPNIVLTADIGSVATSLGSVFGAGNTFWNVGAGLSQPLFDGGALIHRRDAAKAAYDAAAAQYRSTVIAAFQNVADTLHALTADGASVRAAEVAEQEAARSLSLTRQQLALGQVARPSLLLAEQAHQQAAIALVQAQANRLADTAALFQALGGGWWHAPEGAAK